MNRLKNPLSELRTLVHVSYGFRGVTITCISYNRGNKSLTISRLKLKDYILNVLTPTYVLATIYVIKFLDTTVNKGDTTSHENTKFQMTMKFDHYVF